MKKQAALWVSIATLALASVACSMGTRVVQNWEAPDSPPAAIATALPDLQLPQVDIPETLGDSGEASLVSLYQAVNPGVVAIQVFTETGGGQGTGFVFDKKGHIVTNYHVVEGAETLEVDFPSGIKVYGEVIGTDLDSDIAVIEVDVSSDDLTPLPLGDSDQLLVGQTVVAIGNPFGLSGTMTKGIISAKERTLSSFRTTPDGGTFSAGAVIQTDAAINPGNSGGPLLNLSGEVVGINRAIRTESTTAEGESTNSGIGFAISSNIVRRVVPALIESGQYDYPYLGVSSQEDLSLTMREALGIEQTTGAYVTEVRPNSPADDAGLRGGKTDSASGLPVGGDLIVGVDGRPVRVFGELLAYLVTNKGPGDQIILTIIRDNEQMEVTVTLGKRP